MGDRFSRTVRIIGEESFRKIQDSNIVVFGIGGVGSYIVEALVRSGVKKITIVDNDIVNKTNINRQLIALESTIGKYKVDVMKERILDINSKAEVLAVKMLYLPNNSHEFPIDNYDYIIDAIDNVSAKLELICRAEKAHVKIISCMGTGNKIDPSMLKIADIYNTAVCPLARVMRHELKKRGIKKLKVLYSEEKPIKEIIEQEKRTPASISFVPGTAGLMIAGEVIRDIRGLD